MIETITIAGLIIVAAIGFICYGAGYYMANKHNDRESD